MEAAIGYLIDLWHLLVVGSLLTLVGLADRLLSIIKRQGTP